MQRGGEAPRSLAQLVVYDASGQLELVAGPGYVVGYTWSREGEHSCGIVAA